MRSQFTAADLIALGYREGPPSVIDKAASRIFQRRFDDERGRRYFVTFYEYPNTPPTGATVYTAKLATDTKGGGYLWAELSAETIAQIEELAEALWQAAGGVYYERLW